MDNLHRLANAAAGNKTYRQEQDASESVSADSDTLSYKIWFSTPPLSATMLTRLAGVRLTTKARHQGWIDDKGAGSWSWFDIAILDSPHSTKPKQIMGVNLVWLSHINDVDQEGFKVEAGYAFHRESDLVQMLKPGNSLAVRISCRFPGWENVAESGFLELWFDSAVAQHDGAINPVSNQEIKELLARNTELQRGLYAFYDKTAPKHHNPVQSQQADALTLKRIDELTAGRDIPPLRLLSLDGGGVRGISSLRILQEILGKVAPDASDKPYKYFDMIAGTSTGGLIAIMLGRLGMSVQRCVDCYYQLAEEIFKNERSILGIPPKYDADVLAKALKKVVDSETGVTDAMMENNGGEKVPKDLDCKVFVTSTRQDNANNATATHISTFKSKSGGSLNTLSDWRIWEAARATSAAPHYFASADVHNAHYIDGGIQSNNPSIELLMEAKSFFGASSTIGCFISLGTGMSPNLKVEEDPWKHPIDFTDEMVDIVTRTEYTHLVLKEMTYVLPSTSYYRFNLAKPIPGSNPPNYQDLQVAIGDWKKMKQLVQDTETWLASTDVQKQVNDCAQQLNHSKLTS